MSKPTIKYKFLMETNPFGRKVMTNVAEVVASMAAKATAEGKKVPALKYLTAGKTLCEKQIANLNEVVQWMYDNWSEADKGEGEGKIPEPTYDYATAGMKPMAIPYIENMTEVVEVIFEDMEDTEEEEETVTPEEDQDPSHYELVDKSTAPDADTQYYVLNGDNKFVKGGVVDGAWADGDVYTKKAEEQEPQYTYTKVEKFTKVNKEEVTTPVEGTTYYDAEGQAIADVSNWAELTDVYTKNLPDAGTTYYVEDGQGGYVEGGVSEGQFIEGDVYTREEV